MPIKLVLAGHKVILAKCRQVNGQCISAIFMNLVSAIIINSNKINSDQSQFKIWIYSNTQREHSPLEMHGCALKAEC